MDYTVHRILQPRILEWVSVPFSKGNLADPGIEPRSPALQVVLYQLNHQGSKLFEVCFFKDELKLPAGGARWTVRPPLIPPLPPPDSDSTLLLVINGYCKWIFCIYGCVCVTPFKNANWVVVVAF